MGNDRTPRGLLALAVALLFLILTVVSVVTATLISTLQGVGRG